MRTNTSSVGLAAILLTLATGVPRASSLQAQDASVSASAAASSGGKFVGRVTYTGDPIPPRKIMITKDVDHCKDAAGELVEVRVDANGGLADVVIEVQVDGADWEWNEPEGGYILRQKGCQFEPWLLVVPNGANVKVYNDDEVTHNVNTGLWNEMQASGATAVEKPIRGRQGIRVSCNIHSWMEAWIYPARSPYFARTKDDGSFEIAGVPAGTYRVTVWHPTLGRERLRVEITVGETTSEDIEFEAP